MNGADVIAEILKREGTEFLACYPRNPAIDACAAASTANEDGRTGSLPGNFA